MEPDKTNKNSTANNPIPKIKLLDQVRTIIRVHHYSKRTEEAYIKWIKEFITFP